MKKVILYYFSIFIFFFAFIMAPNADTTKIRVDYNSVNLRTGPGTNYFSIKTLGVNSVFSLVDANLYPNESGCDDGWYRIYYSGTEEGYICSSYITLISIPDADPVTTTTCEQELAAAGFPNSYWASLCALKTKYPNWKFTADKNGLDFVTAIEKESIVGKALIQTNNQGYLSTATGAYDFLTDVFSVKEGSNWYAANSGTVAYYLDPRNFLNERSIFMFEKLSYDATYQTLPAVQSVLNNRDMAYYSQSIINASSTNNINAIYLASKIRQETGGNFTNYSLAGNSISYNGAYYEHVYNPYNIGALSGAYDGLVWAVNGTSYLRPWTSLETAISGGASLIASTYISVGQDTVYFQKFNTSSYSSYEAYAHQYMTNVKGAESEAGISYDGYYQMELLSSTAFTFVIPVFENMKSTNYSLPASGNPNNHLKNITINGNTISGFSHDKYAYNFYVSTAVNEIKVGAASINPNAVVTGIGSKTLDSQTTSLTISVTAQNQSVQNYTINVIKTDGIDISVNDIVVNMGLPISDSNMIVSAGYTVNAINLLVQKTAATAVVSFNNKTEGLLATGDVLTITNGGQSTSYTISVKGDPNGDGNINIQDLLKIQKFILGYSELNGSYYKAADTNQDGVVNIVDLLRLQKHILGYLTIS